MQITEQAKIVILKALQGKLLTEEDRAVIEQLFDIEEVAA